MQVKPEDTIIRGILSLESLTRSNAQEARLLLSHDLCFWYSVLEFVV